MGPDRPKPLFSQLLRDDADLREIVEEFVAGLPSRLEEIREAYGRLDWQHLMVLSHRLKGASGSYGYPDLSTLAANMEQAFRAQQAENLGQWMDQFESLIQAAQAGLEQAG